MSTGLPQNEGIIKVIDIARQIRREYVYYAQSLQYNVTVNSRRNAVWVRRGSPERDPTITKIHKSQTGKYTECVACSSIEGCELLGCEYVLLAKSARYDMEVCRSGLFIMGKYGYAHEAAGVVTSLKTGI